MSGQQPQEYSQDNIFFPSINTANSSSFQRSGPPGSAHPDQIQHPVYEPGGMLFEMFNFSNGPGPGPIPPPSDILDYRRAELGSEWYGTTTRHHHHQIIPTLNSDNAESTAGAMQLFATNPPPRSTPSPTPSQQQPGPVQPITNSTLHMLLPSPSEIEAGGGEFHTSLGGVLHHSPTSNNPNYYVHNNNNNPGELGGVVEGQGLSLSLSSSLLHLQATKHGELEGGDNAHQIMFFKNLQQQPQPPIIQSLQGMGGTFGAGPSMMGLGYDLSSMAQHQVHLGFGSGSGSTSSSIGMANALRNSKYAKPAQELLEEFCSVGRGHLFKKSKLERQNSLNHNTDGGASSSATKDPPQLAAADRIEHQRRKVKLITMLDEVDRKYNHYCEQMQTVVNSFDLVMGYGAAIPYTALAQKAMSRHFRCLKETIQAQLKHSCDLLGEKDPTASAWLTKGETPRLKALEQNLRQQRAFHQMGMMEAEAWRPQRGLPERSVNILRAWLFEHFLHPYPNDADKHMLARQTGLSRNQVSNWFINARVRLWKPMVEEMYQQEDKEREEEEEKDKNQSNSSTSNTNTNTDTNTIPSSFSTIHQPPQNPTPNSSSTPSTLLTYRKLHSRSFSPPNAHQQLLPQPPAHVSHPYVHGGNNTCHDYGVGASTDDDNMGSTSMIRFGKSNASGDVSLTLGLRHATSTPDKTAAFSLGDFGSC